MFAALGLLLAAYTLYAAANGRVLAKHGPGARMILRIETPRYFWAVIGVYGLLSVALMVVF